MIACISPVKGRLICSMGRSWENPPPAAPPFDPKTGPSDGSLRAQLTDFPIFARPCVNPMLVVVLPSPAGVGVIAETSISFPSSALLFNKSRWTFALSLP